jgi:ATP-dependent helicase/nuclease subunit A
MSLQLKRDTEIHFPHLAVLKASAGSGKTHTLTARFVQFVLSEKIPNNRLRNILAVTFSNNAAKEMKERVLSWLKSVWFGDHQTVSDLSAIVSMSGEEMKVKAGLLIDEILDNYSDFQIRTIDSFMTSVFKASAVDFGYNPDFDILMSNDSLMKYSFDLCLRSVKKGAVEADRIGEIVDFLHQKKTTGAAYLWDPSAVLLEETKKIYRKMFSTGKRPNMEDNTGELQKVKGRITWIIESIEREIEAAGLKRHGNSSYRSILPLVREGSFPDLIGKGFSNPPVTRPERGGQAAYDRIIELWKEAEDLVSRYAAHFSRSRCLPFVRIYDFFGRTVEIVKRQQGKVFIEDINMHLAEYLRDVIVPDVYFRIGETVYHFFIDEFQDTSPIQWKNLFPLVENSLSQGGSFLAVGDTKQAIYGFRNADYTIMKRLETENPFPSAAHEVEELDTNYRSCRKILEFNERVFKGRVAGSDAYRQAGERSGLTTYVQRPSDAGNEGYAEVSILEKNDDEPAEKKKIQDIVSELRSRGYRHSDIAILTQSNEDAVRTTEWLNEKGIGFISYSSLDVRRRKITGELVALLNFLDSPTDDFSFVIFILSDVFAGAISEDYPGTGREKLTAFCFAHRQDRPIYKAFAAEFGELWQRYFDGLFRTSGFLPLYDLVTEIFAVFRVFDSAPGEEAALVKILESVKDFEGAGFNNIKDFLETAAGEGNGESEWNMAVPRGMDAVQVMTIHKAKGLGFPVVILLLYELKNRGFEYIVEEDEDLATLLKINKPMAACDEGLNVLYERERMKELVNRLNTLYVGLTRPEEELYVLGVFNNVKSYPFDVLPADEYPPSQRPGSRAGAVSKREAGLPVACGLMHRRRRLEFLAGPEGLMSLEEKRRGDYIHRVLSFIDYAGEGFEETLSGVAKRAGDEAGHGLDEDEVKEIVIKLIESEETGLFFRQAPGRKVRREQEYCDGAGRLFRMDRVVIDDDCVTVIDFKTGKRRGAIEAYRAQMKKYMQILSEVYADRGIVGIIAFVDSGEVEKIL